jgi:hypothetical protein
VPWRFSAAGYLVLWRTRNCLNIGGVQIDAAVAEAFLAALAPGGLEASLQAIAQFDVDHETTLAQFRRDVERARYNAQRAERRYRAVDRIDSSRVDSKQNGNPLCWN